MRCRTTSTASKCIRWLLIYKCIHAGSRPTRIIYYCNGIEANPKNGDLYKILSPQLANQDCDGCHMARCSHCIRFGFSSCGTPAILCDWQHQFGCWRCRWYGIGSCGRKTFEVLVEEHLERRYGDGDDTYHLSSPGRNEHGVLLPLRPS